jgi:glycogen debranching enzyme
VDDKDNASERRGLLPRFTLKDGSLFLLADALGDIQAADDGLFIDDTRILSRYELRIGGSRPSLLGAAIDRGNTLFTSHLSNRPLPILGERSIPKGVIHIERCRLLYGGSLHEQVALTNFSESDALLPVVLSFAADFADIFEIQGHVRPERGRLLRPKQSMDAVLLSYKGLDGVARRTWLRFFPQPESLCGEEAQFQFELPRGSTQSLFIRVGTEEEAAPSQTTFRTATHKLRESMEKRLSEGAHIETSGLLFNQWIERSRSDLALLTTALDTGPYPFAGIPWFATEFGRDAIVTALQTLWLNPALAAGVLGFLASTQAQETSAFRDAEPGKILHEMRRGEMAALEEVPFGRYYGGVDTTPLFVILAGAYEARTGDTALTDRIWGALVAALNWIERRMEASPTGFLDYSRGQKSGLVNQAWKDSQDSIFHADGQFPKGPVAVVEVQGYVYGAFTAAAELAAARGDEEQSRIWSGRADSIRRAIEERFWVPEMEYYAIALDGGGAPCKVRASNPGHLLYCGVPDPARAAKVSKHLVGPGLSSGWGIRTLAEGEARYNPMSYHNGSIWPHDTALCAYGMARYGNCAAAIDTLGAIFECAHHFGTRLPELYCGFPRIEGQGPAPYPVACQPQAWASGAVFMLLHAVLGVRIDGRRGEVHIDRRPQLPIGIESLTIAGLGTGAGRLDLEFRRRDGEVAVSPRAHPGGHIRLCLHS